jgi:phospholipid/cholesterol/gamma-HCH transport system substrate-binding protein
VAKRITEILVGLMMLLAITALVFMALKVSGLTDYTGKQGYYKVFADFDNVGSLKVRAPVMIAGVSVGEVEAITLNSTDYRARVTLLIRNNAAKLPVDTSASIYTQGVLGSNYVNLSPGYEEQSLTNNGVITTTNSAVILEKLIGQFLYSFQNKKSDAPTAATAPAAPAVTNTPATAPATSAPAPAATPTTTTTTAGSQP